MGLTKEQLREQMHIVAEMLVKELLETVKKESELPVISQAV